MVSGSLEENVKSLQPTTKTHITYELISKALIALDLREISNTCHRYKSEILPKRRETLHNQ